MMAQESATVETLERGDIWFFYRPRVEEESPEGQKDLQRLYLALHPEDGDYRLAVIGGKGLPDPVKKGKGRYWGFVDLVRKDRKAVEDALAEETYQTKTRSERHLPAARPAGEGKYRIVRHDDHTHLAYALELPKQPDEVQKELNIEKEASYIVSVKNPEKGSPENVGLQKRQKADLPKKLQERFRGRRFADADPPTFLDKEGVEFVLVSASEDVKKELGIEFDLDPERCKTADVYEDLKLDRKEHPPEALCKGEWT